MKTTIDLPDALLRAVKIRAVNEDRRLKDVLAELIAVGLTHGLDGSPRRIVRLPLVQCEHEARVGDEMTPDRVAEVLLQEEARAVS